MTDPAKVVGFLDFFGEWDPTLMFVMGSAVPTFALFYRWGLKKPKPFFAKEFSVPSFNLITPRLVVGSAIFGAGWGLAGLCPGPALTRGGFDVLALGFVATMFLGMKLGDYVIEQHDPSCQESPVVCFLQTTRRLIS